jgi:N-acetylmuramoyl-L-alanine amidase
MRFLSIIISGLVLLSVSGCQGNKGYVKISAPENSLQAICEVRNIPWQWDSISQVFTFTDQKIPVEILVGSRLVMVGSKRVILSSAVERKANVVIVPPDFVKRVFGKEEEKFDVVHPIPLAPGKYHEIMIDAGHGGKDPGAQGLAGTVEKNIVFDIAQRLRNSLENMGFKVDMTRESDEFISLQERTEIATRSKADLFVSIHANSSKSKKTKGLEIYYSRRLEHDPDVAQRKLNEHDLFKRMDISGERAVPEGIISDMMYANKLEESSTFADLVITKTSRNINTVNRGSRTCGFFVVKNTLIPAVLFEVGYITNTAEAKLLKTEEYRQKIADAIAESIKEYSDES